MDNMAVYLFIPSFVIEYSIVETAEHVVHR